MKEGIRKLKFAQQIKKAEGTKTPKVSWRAISFFSGKDNEVIMIFSGGINCVSGWGGHTGVQVQENLAPVSFAQVT